MDGDTDYALLAGSFEGSFRQYNSLSFKFHAMLNPSETERKSRKTPRNKGANFSKLFCIANICCWLPPALPALSIA